MGSRFDLLPNLNKESDQGRGVLVNHEVPEGERILKYDTSTKKDFNVKGPTTSSHAEVNPTKSSKTKLSAQKKPKQNTKSPPKLQPETQPQMIVEP